MSLSLKLSGICSICCDYPFRSVSPGSSSPPIHEDLTGVPGEVPEDEPVPLVYEMYGENREQRSEHIRPGSEATDFPDFKAQNRRLLPNLKNPLHIIDGPDRRYFVGIIDIFTVYGFKKRLEHLWKTLRHPGRSFSTVSPRTYCRRLSQWVQEHTK